MKKSNPVSRLNTTSDLSAEGITKIQQALNPMLADVFALYMKTKNFHWHMSGPHFRDYHLLFDEHADQIFAMTDDIAERVRKLGAITLHSIGEVSRLQRIRDNNEPYVDPLDRAQRRQSEPVGFDAQGTRSLRQIRRCRHCQPDRKLDR